MFQVLGGNRKMEIIFFKYYTTELRRLRDHMNNAFKSSILIRPPRNGTKTDRRLFVERL